MYTRRDHVTQIMPTTSSLMRIFLPNKAIAHPLFDDTRSKTQLSADISLKQLVASVGLIATICLLFISLVICTSAYAKENRWYRYYDNRGIPAISTSVSEQHLKYGYEVLDSHMQVVKRYSPFSAEKYAKQQIIREQAIAKKISDRHLVETYVSSGRATLQRDLELGSIKNQIEQREIESKKISETINENVTSAARFDRQNKPIPQLIKSELEKNKLFLVQSNANIEALKVKKELIKKKFGGVIIELKRIERQTNQTKMQP